MPSQHRSPHLLSVSLVLLAIAVALLILSSTFHVHPSPPTPPAAQPSPPWGFFPTRLPTPTEIPTATPTPAADSPLWIMRTALLYDAPEVAEAAWEKARRVTPEDSPQRGHVLREGARLALLLGNLDVAEARAWDAVRAAAQDAETWALLGVIMARQGEPKIAGQALRIAESLDPGLSPDIFAERWRAACQAHDGATLMALAQTYSSHEPENPLGFYYRAAALLASGESDAALRHLLIQLHAEPDSAAVLWYTLGEAYLAQRAYNEALTALAVAEARFAAGDQSLYLAGDDPLRALNTDRARALVGIGDPEHCAQAESLLRRWNTPADLIERARLCQTPTPTPTWWIPVPIGTPTPKF
ncbi:MAG TPA: hypothetical protein PLH19_01425 [Anaerolineae bacterium]|nr:hypothetical protein [Anaerolineae bacterium]